MKLTRRQILMFVWVLSMAVAGVAVCFGSGTWQFGAATFFGLLAISLGVPLMRALTEFSK